MQHLSEYSDAIKCIKNRRYTPAASYMADSMIEGAVRRIPAEQKSNLTRTIARKLRDAHARLLLAQSGGVALLDMAQRAYEDVQGEMAPALGVAAPGRPTA